MRSQLELLAFIARFNKTFSKYTPAQIITATLLTVFLLWKLKKSIISASSLTHSFISDVNERGYQIAFKQFVSNQLFKFINQIPSTILQQLSNKTANEQSEKLFAPIRQKQYEFENNVKLYATLPDKSLDRSGFAVLLTKNWLQFKKNKTSGTLYADWPAEDMEMFGKLYEIFAFSNPLHTSSWPLVQVLHNKVISMGAKLFHDDNAYGIMTTGGTSSIIEACYAYVRYARKELNIAKPRIIIPESAHVSFDTACEMMDFELIKIPIDPTSKKVDLKKMESAINNRTILLVGSAPNYPYGVMDDIIKIAGMARRHKIYCHVDSCLGGFLTAFVDNSTIIDVPVCDFKIFGVTSISADMHKYGRAPKGSSGLWMRRECKPVKHLTRAYFDWLGGLYIKPSLEGSRTGMNIAATYYAMCRMGMEGYVAQAEKISTLTRELAEACKKIAEINVSGDPTLCVVAFENNNLPNKHAIYCVAEHINENGWELNYLKNGFHICITAEHIQDENFIQNFIDALKKAIQHVKTNPDAKPQGTTKAYGKVDTGLVPHGLFQRLGHAYQEVVNTSIKPDGYIQWLGEISMK